MPYNPQCGSDNGLPSSKKDAFWGASRSNRPLASYNPQFGKPALSLPQAASPLVRKAVRWCVVGVVLLVLANVAFTPEGMRGFWLGVARELAWLTGSQNGNRLVALALFTVSVGAVVAFGRHSLIARYGSGVFGWI